MKKNFILLFLLCINLFVIAQTPYVCIMSNSGPKCEASTADIFSPCQTIPYVVTGYTQIPNGYDRFAKFEWFLNGVLTKTSTDITDYGFNPVVLSQGLNAFCNVYYKKNDGTLSAPFRSTTLAPRLQSLNFLGITSNNSSPNYGCTNQAISFNLSQYTCSSLCDYTYNLLDPYSITWQAPSGWLQTSISPNGNDVSFLPDASSGGALTATIHLACGYTEIRTFNINRAAPSPTFTAANVTSCTSSSASMSINTICGAISYTYTIEGSPDVTFTANGQQTLTSTNTTIDFSISGSSSSLNTIKAKANYPNNISSTESSSTLIIGKPTTTCQQIGNGICTQMNFICPSQLAGWKYGNLYGDLGGTITGYHLQVNGGGYFNNGLTTQDITTNYFSVYVPSSGNNVTVWAMNACGVSQNVPYVVVYAPKSYGCGYYYSVSPNPATSTVTVAANDVSSSAKTVGATTTKANIAQIEVRDKLGTLKKKFKYDGKTGNASFNVADLPNDVYIIRIFDGTNWEEQKILVQK